MTSGFQEMNKVLNEIEIRVAKRATNAEAKSISDCNPSLSAYAHSNEEDVPSFESEEDVQSLELEEHKQRSAYDIYPVGALYSGRRHHDSAEFTFPENKDVPVLPNEIIQLVDAEHNAPSPTLETKFDDGNMWKCFQFFYLFPGTYEFDKDDMVQLWIAEGFIPQAETGINMEDTASAYFDEFLSMSSFQFSRLDSSSGRPRYKLNQSNFKALHKEHNHEYCRVEDPQSVNVSKDTLHSSLLSNDAKPAILGKLYKSEKLCTLLLLHEHVSHINRVPPDFFQRLRFFRVLDLSHTNIKELPSSIGNLKELRYLNLSMTCIASLPESFCTLTRMQTLKLKDCLALNDLPKDLRRLSDLRYLDLDVGYLLNTMPPGLGDLTELRMLPAFIVGKESGYHVTELKTLVNLRGTLRILCLENISDTEVAGQAELYKKKYLDKLELQWTESQDITEVLEGLRPHTNLKELQIVGYGGAKFPDWVGNSFFSNLVTLTLHNCKKCEFLPPFGMLPSLGSLSISEIFAVKTIDNQFCGRDKEKNFDILKRIFGKKGDLQHSNDDMFRAFPRLDNFKLNGMPNLEKWIGVEKGEFALLHKLNISGVTKIVALPELSLFKSLEQLEISLCPLLQSLSKRALPTSLQSLLIIGCPKLKERCSKKGKDWWKIAHIHNICIDYQQIL